MQSSKQMLLRALTRRKALKLSGLTLGGLAIGGGVGAGKARAVECSGQTNQCGYPADPDDTQRYSFLKNLKPLPPHTPLEPDEMRISFMGSIIPNPRRAQAEMSVFVEVGPWVPPEDPMYHGNPAYGRATDSFIFDCGAGVSANYQAMAIAFRKMTKVFINHLHGDHMSDLSHIYCFGVAGDRKSPLYVWGPGPSRVKSPGPPRRLYDDGTKAFCEHLRAAMRWHTESFSFLDTSYAGYRDNPPTRESWGLPCDPIPVGDDPPYDGYAMIPIELDWRKVGGVAYNNPDTGVKITHFPVIHCRKGSIGYKLEWNGMSMIYTSDTKPERLSIDQASGGKGVDVFIHEMVPPPEVHTMKNMGLDHIPAPGEPIYPAFQRGVEMTTAVHDSSHTPQGAFGYLLSQIDPHPRLTVATHFPVTDDTVECALQSVRNHCDWVSWDPEKPDDGNITWSFDCMVIRVFPDRIEQCMAKVSDFSFAPPAVAYDEPLPPKYHDENGDPDPTAQLDLSTWIPPTEEDGTVNYCGDGY